jgi:uncharacterized protein
MKLPAQAPVAQPLLGLGEVRHQRLQPVTHGFAYGTYFLMLPMRALRQAGSAALPRNRFGLLSFHDRDHGEGGADSLAWAESLLAADGLLEQADGEIWLHTYPRVLGYAFKPVSFWYCERRDGSLVAVLAEVNNTFGERHVYLLGGTGRSLRYGHELSAAKVFHVSPFCSVEGSYRFRFMRTGERLVARVEHDNAQGDPLLLTSVSGRLTPLSAALAWRSFWRMPMMTFGVIARIHWQALRLWRRRVPWFSKPAPPTSFVSR